MKIPKTKREVPLAQFKTRLQRKVNSYVRLRDRNVPCIACGKYGTMHASHYISQGSSGLLRFHLDNINNSCVSCNLFKHGNLISYRIGLVKKIGLDRVMWLEDHRHDIFKWTRSDLEQIEFEIKKLMKGL